jgi:hypothetical protein
VTSVAFTPNGRNLLSGDTNGKATLWLLDTAPRGSATIDISHAAAAYVVVAARTDDEIITMDKRGEALLWNIGSSALLTQACAVVGRDLTPEEWGELLPDRAYQPTCVT